MLSDGNRSPYLSTERLEHAIQTYAASALVTPIRIPGAQIAPGTWSSVHKLAKSWGLLSDTDHRVAFNHSIIICKRAPLPRLKRSLFEKTSFGCFRMLSVGNLSPDALKRLFAADPLIYDHVDDADSEHSSLGEADDVPSRVFAAATDGDDPYADEPVTRLLRHFRSTAPPSATAGIKIEPTTSDSLLPPAVVQEDCMLVSAELNQPSNAIEILDDLPRTLIPGIDF